MAPPTRRWLTTRPIRNCKSQPRRVGKTQERVVGEAVLHWVTLLPAKAAQSCASLPRAVDAFALAFLVWQVPHKPARCSVRRLASIAEGPYVVKLVAGWQQAAACCIATVAQRRRLSARRHPRCASAAGSSSPGRVVHRVVYGRPAACTGWCCGCIGRAQFSVRRWVPPYKAQAEAAQLHMDSVTRSGMYVPSTSVDGEQCSG